MILADALSISLIMDLAAIHRRCAKRLYCQLISFEHDHWWVLTPPVSRMIKGDYHVLTGIYHKSTRVGIQ